MEGYYSIGGLGFDINSLVTADIPICGTGMCQVTIGDTVRTGRNTCECAKLYELKKQEEAKGG